MIELGCLLILGSVFAYREWISRRDREVEREVQRAREQDWADERCSLLNRIKPDTAQPTRTLEDPELLEPVRTDEEWWETHNPYAKAMTEMERNGDS